MFVDKLTEILTLIGNYVMGLPFVVLIVMTGIFFTVRLLVPQVRKLGHGVAITLGYYDKPEHKGDISHFQALCAALAATIGVGNIAGVATAIHVGGPGALFWMWVSGFFGMALKCAECTLAQKYRVVNADGSVSGGPMYYIEKGLGPGFKWLACIFAFCCIVATLGGGNMVQSNSLTIAIVDHFAVQKYYDDLPLSTLNNGNGISPPEADEDAEFQIGLKNGVLLDIDISDAKTVKDLLNKINLHPENHQQMVSAEISLDKNSIDIVDNTQDNGTFTIIPLNNSQALSDLNLLKKDGSLNRLSENKITTVIPEKLLLRVVIGLFIAFTVGLVIIGGIKRIGKVAGKVVPLMCATYVIGALIIIFFNYDRIPETFYLIFKHAFTPTSAVGGFAGATVLYTITWGVKRAVFSNEAGVGSAPIAHAAARTDEPVREGLVALLGPLIDTLVLCTMTAFVIVLTGSWQTGADSSILTKNAFEAGIPVFGGLIVTTGLIFFSITTAISWSYYGDRCALYLFGPGAVMPYRWIFVVVLFIGAITEIDFVWGFSDITFGLMAFPNLIAIIALSDNMVGFFKDYFSRRHERTK